jgi:hypothetical protein
VRSEAGFCQKQLGDRKLTKDHRSATLLARPSHGILSASDLDVSDFGDSAFMSAFVAAGLKVINPWQKTEYR